MFKVHGSKILQAVSTATQFQGFHFLHCLQPEGTAADQNSPFAHAFLQVGQQKLAVKGVDGGDVGEDVLHHLYGERAFICLLHELGAENLRSRWQRDD